MNPSRKRFNRGLVFGVFDVFHKGHHHFLEQAESYCETLVVVVTPDETVRILKNRLPRQSLVERIEVLRKTSPHWKVVTGDDHPGSWQVLQKEKPDVIFLGYDQQALNDALTNISVPVLWLEPHKPHRYKSSLIGRN